MKGLHFNLSSSAWLIAKTIGSLLLYRQYTCTFILGSNFISSLKCVLFLINSIFAFKGKAMIEYNCRKKGFFLFYWYLHIYFNVYECTPVHQCMQNRSSSCKHWLLHIFGCVLAIFLLQESRWPSVIGINPLLEYVVICSS